MRDLFGLRKPAPPPEPPHHPIRRVTRTPEETARAIALGELRRVLNEAEGSLSTGDKLGLKTRVHPVARQLSQTLPPARELVRRCDESGLVVPAAELDAARVPMEEPLRALWEALRQVKDPHRRPSPPPPPEDPETWLAGFCENDRRSVEEAFRGAVRAGRRTPFEVAHAVRDVFLRKSDAGFIARSVETHQRTARAYAQQLLDAKQAGEQQETAERQEFREWQRMRSAGGTER
jgi:hypothetical protein